MVGFNLHFNVLAKAAIVGLFKRWSFLLVMAAKRNGAAGAAPRRC
jgi:hypothetical protein